MMPPGGEVKDGLSSDPTLLQVLAKVHVARTNLVTKGLGGTGSPASEKGRACSATSLSRTASIRIHLARSRTRSVNTGRSARHQGDRPESRVLRPTLRESHLPHAAELHPPTTKRTSRDRPTPSSFLERMK
jgi:hypothetical protein